MHRVGRNKKVYEPPRYMTAAEAAHQLVTVVANRRASGNTDLGHPCSFSLLSFNSFLLVFSIQYSLASGNVINRL